MHTSTQYVGEDFDKDNVGFNKNTDYDLKWNYYDQQLTLLSDQIYK